MQYFYWTLVSAEIDFKLFLDKIPLLLFVVETRKNSLITFQMQIRPLIGGRDKANLF